MEAIETTALTRTIVREVVRESATTVALEVALEIALEGVTNQAVAEVALEDVSAPYFHFSYLGLWLDTRRRKANASQRRGDRAPVLVEIATRQTHTTPKVQARLVLPLQTVLQRMTIIPRHQTFPLHLAQQSRPKRVARVMMHLRFAVLRL